MRLEGKHCTLDAAKSIDKAGDLQITAHEAGEMKTLWLDKKQIVRSSTRSFDEAQGAALWELSASLTGIPSETPMPSTSSA